VQIVQLAFPSGLIRFDQSQKGEAMNTETTYTVTEPRKTRVVYRGSSSDAVYGLGLIGALVFYLGHAATFWIGVLGVLKSIVWPAMLVYEILKYLNM
jgi:hypothetical protein